MQKRAVGMTNLPQGSNITTEQAWGLIDKVLLQAKTGEIAEEMHKKIAKAKSVAHGEGLRKKNGAYYPHRRIVLEEEAADEWAQKLYDTALRVWQIQGYKPCLPFTRAIYGHLLAPLFAARRGAVTSDMQLTELRTRTSGSTQAHRGAFVRAIGRLESRWKRRMEAAGREFDYAARREELSKTEALKALAGLHPTPEQPRTPVKKARSRPLLPKAQLIRRRVIFGVLELNRRGLDYCRELDRRKLPTPTGWQENGCPVAYAAAYRFPQWAQSIQNEKSNFDRLRRRLGPTEVAKIVAVSPRSAG
jgi:hypothetical protein